MIKVQPGLMISAPDAVQGTGSTVASKTDMTSDLLDFVFQWERQYILKNHVSTYYISIILKSVVKWELHNSTPV